MPDLPIRKLRIESSHQDIFIHEKGQPDRVLPFGDEDYNEDSGRFRKSFWERNGYENCILRVKDNDLDQNYKVTLNRK